MACSTPPKSDSYPSSQPAPPPPPPQPSPPEQPSDAWILSVLAAVYQMQDLADRLLALEAEEWLLLRRAALCECHERLTPLGNIFFTILISYGYSGFGVIAHTVLEWWRPSSPSAWSSPPCLFPPLCWTDASSAGSTGTGTVTVTPAANVIVAYAVRDIIASWYIFIFSTTAIRRPLVYTVLFAGCRAFIWEGWMWVWNWIVLAVT